MSLRIGIAGITGRMGRLLAAAVPASGAVLAGGISRTDAETKLPGDAPRCADLAALAGACDVVIDFTHAAAVAGHAAALAERMGAALPAEQYDVEILEMHHRQKVDAPSGTAIGIGRAVAAGRGVALEDVMESGRHGHTGPRKTGAIGFAALRGGQVVGEHSLIFAAGAEQIVLTHRAFDRASFADGAVRAAHWLAGRQPGLYGMADVLGMR